MFLVREQAFTRAELEGALEAVAEVTGPPSSGASLAEYADALEQRLAGESRWDTLVPRYQGPTDSGEGLRARNQTLHTSTNILRSRRYAQFERDDVGYVVDAFNPRNELGLTYVGAGEPVLVLLLSDLAFPRVRTNLAVRDRLVEVDSFYRTLEALISSVAPDRVSGGTYLVRVIMAYRDERRRLPIEARPWDLLWTLNVWRSSAVKMQDLERARPYVTKMTKLGGDRVLLQVRPGLNQRMDDEYVLAAREIGVTAVTEVGE